MSVWDIEQMRRSALSRTLCVVLRMQSHCINLDLFQIIPKFDCSFFFLCFNLSLSHRDSEGRKLCKKVKVDPSSKRGGAELLHYKWVTRNSAGCQTLFHTSVLSGKEYCVGSLGSMLFTVYSWCCEHCAWCILQRWDVSHRVQQARYLQGECAAETLRSLLEHSA